VGVVGAGLAKDLWALAKNLGQNPPVQELGIRELRKLRRLREKLPLASCLFSRTTQLPIM